MVVKVGPIVKAPHEAGQIRGGEPEKTSRCYAARVKLVGCVVDGIGGKRPLVFEAKSRRVYAG